MHISSLPWPLVACGALVLGTFVGIHADLGRAQPPIPTGAPAPRPGLTPVYSGAVSCSQCHIEKPQGIQETFLCRLNEFKKWQEGDKHQDAYRVLQGDRAKEMGKNLGFDVVGSKACLSCHGVVITDPQMADRSKKALFKLEEGVTCVVCHGAYEEWVEKHGLLAKLADWRHYTREKKEKDFGMTDLWDPVKRASQCAGCHIGDARAGKVVTHEMYAAGHPPLPSFEVATFSDQMPRHWEYLREKKKEVQEVLHFDEREREKTKLVLVGSAVALRASLQLVAADAEECRHGGNGKRALDYANFDCYACHHDLKSPAWRQQRGYTDTPGRPTMQSWPRALVRLAIHQAAADQAAATGDLERFNAGLAKVQAAYAAHPLGDPAQVAPAAAELAAWAGGLADRVAGQPCSQKRAQELLRRLPALFEKDLLDYDSARQVAWALDTFLHDAGEKPDPDMIRTPASLEGQLRLQLPSGRKQSITDRLGQNLAKRNGYDPAAFQRTLAELSLRLTR